MLIGIDVRDAGMAAFEVQPGWRDHTFEQVQRRARRADTLRGEGTRVRNVGKAYHFVTGGEVSRPRFAPGIGGSRRAAHEARIEFLHQPNAALLHGGVGFRPQEIEHALDAFLAERA